ncbi:MAG: DUF3052 domain-containing protein [Gemmatimonadales bacterium]
MTRTAGYSGKSLRVKLGLKERARVVALGAPREYRRLLRPIPHGVSFTTRLPKSAAFVHWFVRSRRELERGFGRVATALADTGVLWISWPKKSSGVSSDVTEDVLREVGLPHGLVDVKVCAVDNTWSGLKFVRRMENRRRADVTA